MSEAIGEFIDAILKSRQYRRDLVEPGSGHRTKTGVISPGKNPVKGRSASAVLGLKPPGLEVE